MKGESVGHEEIQLLLYLSRSPGVGRPHHASHRLESVGIVMRELSHFSCDWSAITDTHTVIPCPSVTHTATPSLSPSSLYTGSPLCSHCLLCHNDLEISGLVIISAFPTNRAITPPECWSDHYGYVYLVYFKARRLSDISINCQAMHWFQMGYHYTDSFFKNITHSSASGLHCWSRWKALLDNLDKGFFLGGGVHLKLDL